MFGGEVEEFVGRVFVEIIGFNLEFFGEGDVMGVVVRIFWIID